MEEKEAMTINHNNLNIEFKLYCYSSASLNVSNNVQIPVINEIT